ncbi:mercuric reductase [Rhizobium sp. Leaf384]|uniref:FAD-containing oxidoreductase n=1 Tax=unclassified Rhizobium TaxID=2613769 RepID=UPI0007152C2E|nr:MULTISPECIES: FAD-containing oxidoreductase [unclassified Rhizobium]KQS75282.1 mercuric reductase [Rhizobium sp. Leaf383]KQS78801.1 mercuric reductase [Rhizobium sp. Leaf384]
MRAFDAIIIGAGQAGPSLAARLSAAGRSVAIIERKHVGGTCVNTGCKPTKALVASAHAAHIVRRASDFGVIIDADVRIDMAAVVRRSHQITLDSRRSNEVWLAGLETCTLIRGHACFEDANTVRVGDERLTAPQIFINVGGRATVPDFPGIRDVPFMTNSDIVMLDRLPQHLIVVGGSYIGLEFAQMYRRFGAKVTVVEKGPRLVAREDKDISEAIRAILEAEGIDVRTSSECIRFAREGEDLVVGVNGLEGEPALRGSDILLATGRTPNTDDLGLERAGVAVDGRGYIQVDDALATSVPGIWAMGDCNGRGAFTHTAYNDYEIIAANLLDGETRKVSDRLPGYALYIDPPLGRVGMSEREARASGRPILVGQLPMTRVGRAVEKGETQGLMKIVADAETRQILGAAILGTGGDEAIHGVLDMMNVGARYDDLRWAVPVHPTVSEFWPTLVLGMKPVQGP